MLYTLNTYITILIVKYYLNKAEKYSIMQHKKQYMLIKFKNTHR